MTKILILGVGNAQVDFINFCKYNGFEVHSCSYKMEGRGIPLSDYFTKINISDYKKISEYVKKNNINLIYSIGSDIALPSISEASDLNNLPHFISTNTAITCNNKSLLRETLKSIPEYTVNYKELKDLHSIDSWDRFPAVIKPVDSQGQRGVAFVKDSISLKNNLYQALLHSKSNKAIVEDYVDGFEISANIYLVDGNIQFYFITERISFNNYPGGIIKKHLYPLTKNVNETKLLDMFKKVFSLLNIFNGPAYIQAKVDKEGNPKVIEVTPRLDGCHMWRFIKEISGLNLLEIVIKHLSTGRIDSNAFANHTHFKNSSGELSFFTKKPGSVMNQSDFIINLNSSYFEWFYDDGEVVREINGYQEKVGYQIILQK